MVSIFGEFRKKQQVQESAGEGQEKFKTLSVDRAYELFADDERIIEAAEAYNELLTQIDYSGAQTVPEDRARLSALERTIRNVMAEKGYALEFTPASHNRNTDASIEAFVSEFDDGGSEAGGMQQRNVA